MKFKQLLHKYKKGSATEEEKHLVEQEIEKYEAIEEYLSDMVDMNLGITWESEQYKEESINIKKSVNSRLRRVIFTSVGIMVALLIGVFYIISPIVDNLYYNPTKITVAETYQDINFDIKAITELNYPGYTLSSWVNVDKLGFGEYDISYFRTNLFTEETTYVNSKLKRNMNITNHTSWTNDRSFNFTTVRVPDWVTLEDSLEQKSRVMDHIKQLSPVSYISAWLTFENDLNMEELHQLELAYPDVQFVWVGIRTASPKESVPDLLGFITHSTKLGVDKPDKEKYPAFDYLEWLINPIGFDREVQRIEPRGYELHFKDRLKYTLDRKDAVNILERRPNRHEYYEKALNYVEEHGVKTYGVLVYSNGQDLIEIIENGPILTLELNQVLASKRYIR